MVSSVVITPWRYVAHPFQTLVDQLVLALVLAGTPDSFISLITVDEQGGANRVLTGIVAAGTVVVT